MQATYNLNSNELTYDFLNSIKSMFKDKNINITISDNTKLDERSQELQNRLKEYKNNPELSTPVTDDFWKNNEKRLIQKHTKQAI